jgi:outer membrane protein TolC
MQIGLERGSLRDVEDANMNKVLKGLAALVFCFLVPRFFWGAEIQRVLTLSQVLKRGISSNPGLKAFKAESQSAFYRYRSLKSLPGIIFAGSYSNGNNGNFTQSGVPQDLNVGLSESFGPFGSISQAGKIGFQRYKITQQNYALADLSLEQSLKNSFYDLLASQEKLKASQENLTLANRLYHLVKKEYQAGEVPETDLISARIQKASSIQIHLQTQSLFKQNQTALNALLAYPPNHPIVVSGTLKLPYLPYLSSKTLYAHIQNHPEIRAAELTVQAARSQTAFIRTQYYPAPSIFYNYDLSITPFWEVGLNLQFPVFDFGSLGNQVKSQEKTVIQDRQALKQIRLTLLSKVQSAYTAYQSDYQNVLTYRQNVLLPSLQLMKMTEFGYKKGALPYLVVLQAQQTLSRARFHYLSLLLQGHQDLDLLEAAAGNVLRIIHKSYGHKK